MKHFVSLICADVLPEDAANYTCQIDGPMNAVIGSVTHSVTVRGMWQNSTVLQQQLTTLKCIDPMSKVAPYCSKNTSLGLARICSNSVRRSVSN